MWQTPRTTSARREVRESPTKRRKSSGQKAARRRVDSVVLCSGNSWTLAEVCLLFILSSFVSFFSDGQFPRRLQRHRRFPSACEELLWPCCSSTLLSLLGVVTRGFLVQNVDHTDADGGEERLDPCFSQSQTSTWNVHQSHQSLPDHMEQPRWAKPRSALFATTRQVG